MGESISMKCRIQWIRVRNADGQKYLWEIEKTRHGQSNLPRVIHAKAGESIRLNLASSHRERKPAEVYSLFQLRGGSYHSSYVRSGRFDAGCLVLDDLEAGDYELYLKDLAHSIRIRISDGERTKEQDFIFSRHRHLEGSLLSLSILPTSRLKRVRQSSSSVTPPRFARVHVFATRYAPLPTLQAFRCSYLQRSLQRWTCPASSPLCGRPGYR